MTTGLAFILFGWAGAIYEVLYLLKGERAAGKYMDTVMNTYGSFVENTLDKIFNYGIE